MPADSLALVGVGDDRARFGERDRVVRHQRAAKNNSTPKIPPRRKLVTHSV
jgi:hypothetical protein